MTEVAAVQPKQNRGNRRTGKSRGTHSGRRRGTLAWDRDEVILARLALVRTLKAQGHTAQSMLPMVNALMQRQNAPEVTVAAVWDDFARLRVIQQREMARAADVEDHARRDHLESLQEVKQRAWQAYHTQPGRQPAYLNVLVKAEETAARIDGTLQPTVINMLLASPEFVRVQTALKVLCQEYPEVANRLRELLGDARSAIVDAPRLDAPDGHDEADAPD